MARENEQSTMIFEPLIDSKNPPIGVDSIMLAEAGTGNVRVSCFSGNVFVEREENISSQDGSNVTRKWIRPVCVLDVGAGAVNYLEGYLLHRLSQNPDEMKKILNQFPYLVDLLKTILASEKAGEVNAE